MDALLLDDLHFLAGKKATQEEFLHTFDSLQADGRQIVVTCDCHPRLTDDFVPELADRLLGGAVWGLQPPDAATRLDLLRSKAAKLNVLIDEQVLKFLAEQLRGNVRELEGRLNSLRHYAKVTGRPIDVAAGSGSARRPAPARRAGGDAGRHRCGRLPGAAAADRDAPEQGPRPGRSATRGCWPSSWPASTRPRPTARSASTSAAETTRPPWPPRSGSASWLADDDTLSLNQRPWRVRELIEQAERLLGR